MIYKINKTILCSLLSLSMACQFIKPLQAEELNEEIVEENTSTEIEEEETLEVESEYVEVEDDVEKDFSYTIINGEVQINRYIGKSDTMVIPSTIEGYPVTKIGEDAFKFNNAVKIVTIPSSIQEIGTNAFGYMSSLHTINYQALNCKDFLREGSPFYYSGDGNHLSVNISDEVTRIPNGLFYDCKVTSVNFGKNLESIGEYAFRECDYLYSLILGNKITTINKEAFMGCTNLSNVKIGDNVTTIGDKAFMKCTNLSSVNIGSGVKTIGNQAFQGCISLGSIIISDSVTSIGDSAFSQCSALKTITFGNSVNSLGANVLDSCSRLESLTIPNSVETIGSKAFQNCTSLKEVYIGTGVKNIDTDAFKQTSSLKKVEFHAIECTNDNVLYYIANQKYPFEAAGSREGFDLIIGDEVKEIGAFLFSKSNVLHVKFGNSIQIIGLGAFQECPYLKDVIFSSRFDTMCEKTFANCPALRTVKFVGEAPTIKDDVFYQCKDEVICYYPAEYYDSWKSIIEDVYNYGTDFKWTPTTGFEYTIENGEVTITAFNDVVDILDIPETMEGYPVKYIADKAFQYNFASTVIIPKGIKKIGTRAFSYMHNLKTVQYNAVQCEDSQAPNAFYQPGYYLAVEFSDDVIQIPRYLFSGSYIEEVTFGKNIKEIGDNAFRESRVKTINGWGSSLEKIGNNAFYECDLEEITIPETVKLLGVNSFGKISNLKTVHFNAIDCDSYDSSENQGLNCAFYGSYPTIILGEKVTKIPDGLFFGTKSTDITIGSSVKEIGNNSFASTALVNLTFDCELTKIDRYAFGFNDSLKTITFKGKAPASFDMSAFSDTSVTCYYPIEERSSWLKYVDGTYNFGNVTWEAYSYFESVVNNGEATIIGYSGLGGDVVLPSYCNGVKVTGVGDSAFINDSRIISLTIPKGIKSIGASAFSFMSKLEYVNYLAENCNEGLSVVRLCFQDSGTSHMRIDIGDNVKIIPPGMFNSSNVNSVYIGSYPLDIQLRAFAYCRNLDYIMFKGEVKQFDSEAFLGNNLTCYYPQDEYDSWKSVKGRKFGGESVTWKQHTNYLFTISDEQATIIGYWGNNENLEISEELDGYPVVAIGQGAFKELSFIKTVTIPKTVVRMDSESFAHLSNLEYIKFKGDVPNIEMDAFLMNSFTCYYPSEKSVEWKKGIVNRYGANQIVWKDYLDSTINPDEMQPVIVTSPNWPENYPNRCTESNTKQTFKFEGAQKIWVIFFSECGTEKDYDWIRIYDDKNLIYTFTGDEMVGKRCFISGDEISISFISDRTNTDIGFKARIVPIYSRREMVMTSPNWPENYPNNCTEESTNREFFFDDADHLEITFDKDSFMEMANNGTMYDYVSVKSLYREEYKLSGTSFAGKTYTVPGNYVELAFVSDNDITRKGYKCTIKPVYTEQVEQPVLLKGYSLSLSGDIGINFYMSLPYEMTNNPDQTYMNFTLPDGTQKDVYLNEAMIKTVDGEDYYVFPINVSAKDMTGKVSAKICKSGKVYDTYTYSVLDYAQYVANRPNLFNKDVLNIVSGMLNYGSAAQTYFGFKTEEMPLSPMAIYPDLKEYQYKLIDNSSIEFVGARLLLKSKPGIKFYFTGATEKTTFQLNGKALKTHQEDEYIVITISNIEDMRKMYTITARNFSLTYGVYSYGYSALSSSKVNEDLKNLIGAMYMYNSILYNEL